MRFSIKFLIIIVIASIGIFVLAQVDDEPTFPSVPDIVTDDGIMISNGLRHSVPLADIIFDDFDSPTRVRPMTDATPTDIERLRDRIRPICAGEIAACVSLVYEDVSAADRWLGDISTVLGYVDEDGQAYVYPFNILNFHEIVNDTLADEPVLISYCPLCNSAIVYSRVVDEQELVFGNTSALYNSDMVMYDTATASFWFQVEGRAIVGELTDTELRLLPSTTTNWADWKAQHPDSLVLARPDTGINYGRNPFVSYESRINDGDFFFPVDDDITADTRLEAGETVLLIEIAEEARAYPLAQLGNAVTRDTIAEHNIIILSLADTPSGAAYQPITDDGTMVDIVYEDESWRDVNSGSQFNLSGEAISGTLKGEQLVPIAARYTFWFAAVATAPHVQVYTP